MLTDNDCLNVLFPPLSSGELAVFATDTVIGLGCRIYRPDLVKKICAVKGRPINQPMALLVSSVAAVEEISATKLNRDLQILAEKCWPGPLTFLVKVNAERIKSHPEWYALLAPSGFLGVRLPACPPLLEVIDKMGGAIIATSANLHGEKTPLSAADLAPAIKKAAGGIWLPPGLKTSGLASTVVKVEGESIKLLREGFFSLKQLKEFLGYDKRA